jgi:NADPH:quinone reductase-like Zn-dependent oxidoreductase
MPANMTFAEAAAIPVQYLTAYMMLHELAHVKPGDSVLVHMAAGGVGTAACQILRAVGEVVVFGTASASKHDHARANGCTNPIDYRTSDYVSAVREATNERGVDIILDPLGGGDIAKNYSLLAPLGRQVVFGASNFVSGSATLSGMHALSTWWKTAKLDPMDMLSSSKAVMGYNLGQLVHDVPRIRSSMQAVLALYEAGSIHPHIDSMFSFEKAGAAHKCMVDRLNKGKLVLAWQPLPPSEVPRRFAGRSSANPSGEGDFVLEKQE